MTRTGKRLVAMLLAIFAMAAMSLSVVQAGTMALEMSAMANHMDAADGCVPCPGGQDEADGMACPPLCVAPAVAVLPSVMTLDIASASSTYPFAYSPRLGRESLPDPHPPRTSRSV